MSKCPTCGQPYLLDARGLILPCDHATREQPFGWHRGGSFVRRTTQSARIMEQDGWTPLYEHTKEPT